MTALEEQEQEQGKGVSTQPESIDTSLRKLLGSAGKAAWIVPTLTLLSLTKVSAQNLNPCQQPNPPPQCPS